MFRLHLDQSFEEIYEAPYQRLISFQTAYQRLIQELPPPMRRLIQPPGLRLIHPPARLIQPPRLIQLLRGPL